ncbi:metallophosphoesterase [Fictibacillus macauensis ZFHKF-1]|uniref:Phosphoesterase n=1 Tax=Fictibacillus macauensis ZFHKF-1 TaxID=1196324 RepID=I8J2U1_9BACL|nr:metallophosphoesterase family protein [Fictibacillus macauensis]EIT86066.1 metallophosphoesterase [Fictibacillus macauensis ZFHKF-1]
MKLGIISDIHGNAAALKAVLAKLQDDHHVDMIYCLGDLIGYGPDTNEVLELLFSREDVAMVTGNHDEAILALLTNTPYPDYHPNLKEHHEWIAHHIDLSYVPHLQQLPRVITREINHVHLWFAHYQLVPGHETLTIADEPFSPIVGINPYQLDQLFKDVMADLICFGHRHPLHYFKTAHSTYLNPGALGCSRTQTAPYALVSLTNHTMNIELHNAPYDNTAFLASYATLQVPDRAYILKMMHGNQQLR